MSENEHLRQILRSLDSADEHVPDFADELWTELDAAYDKAAATTPTNQTLLNHTSSDTEDFEVLELHLPDPEPLRSRGPGGRRQGLVAGAVAAGIIALAFFGGMELLDRIDDRDRTPVQSTAAVTLDEACFLYRTVDPSIADIKVVILNDDSINVDDIRTLQDSVDQIRELLQESNPEAERLQSYARGSALLGQAALEVERGLLAQAHQTLGDAEEVIELADTPGAAGQRDPCTAP